MGWFTAETAEEKKQREEAELAKERVRVDAIVERINDALIHYRDSFCLNSSSKIYIYRGAISSKNSDGEPAVFIQKTSAVSINKGEILGTYVPNYFMNASSSVIETIKADRQRFIELKLDLKKLGVQIIKEIQ